MRGVGSLLVVASIAFVRRRYFRRGDRMRRFARAHGFGYLDVGGRPADAWRDLATMRIGKASVALDTMTGERGGRRFAAFHFHSGFDTVTHAGLPVATPGQPLHPERPFDVAQSHAAVEPSCSVVVVECELPPQAPIAESQASLARWRPEFGRHASLVRSEDGVWSPKEMLEALDVLVAELNGSLLRR